MTDEVITLVYGAYIYLANLLYNAVVCISQGIILFMNMTGEQNKS